MKSACILTSIFPFFLHFKICEHEECTFKLLETIYIYVDHASGDEDQEDRGDEGVDYEELRPTFTHEALCRLVDLDLVKHVVSQNGDGLHGLSGISKEHLSELHGNVFIEKCEKCHHRYERTFYVMDDTGSQYFEDIDDYGKSEVKKPRHAKRCDTCGLSHRTGRKCEQKVRI